MDAMVEALSREHPERLHGPAIAPVRSEKKPDQTPAEILQDLDATVLKCELQNVWKRINRLRNEVLALDRDPVLGATRRRIQGSVIVQIIAEEYGTPVDEILGLRRTKRSTFVRHIAMHMVKRLTPLALPQIGKVFNRDHTTVMHACRMMDRRRHADSEFAHELTKLEILIKARRGKT